MRAFWNGFFISSCILLCVIQCVLVSQLEIEITCKDWIEMDDDWNEVTQQNNQRKQTTQPQHSKRRKQWSFAKYKTFSMAKLL